jgi:hypothetical protein
MASFFTRLFQSQFNPPGSKNIRNAFNFSKLGDEYTTGANYLDYGKSITDSALAGLNKHQSDLEARLAEGLPADVRQAYAAEQGRITDTAAQSKNAFAKSLVQRARAGGGQITDQAALDSSIENNASVDEAAFNARNQVAADEANASLQNTYKLLDSIQGILDTKAGLGISQENIGSQIYQAALRNMLDRRKAIAGTATSIIGGAVGSSREFKRDVIDLDEASAVEAFEKLNPVVFTYKGSGESHVGFIAEDVPDLVAMPGRKSLHPMDFVGVLTKVLQAQQSTIESLTARLDAVEAR